METKNGTKKGFLEYFDLSTAEIKQMADVMSQSECSDDYPSHHLVLNISNGHNSTSTTDSSRAVNKNRILVSTGGGEKTILPLSWHGTSWYLKISVGHYIGCPDVEPILILVRIECFRRHSLRSPFRQPTEFFDKIRNTSIQNSNIPLTTIIAFAGGLGTGAAGVSGNAAALAALDLSPGFLFFPDGSAVGVTPGLAVGVAATDTGSFFALNL